jgi:hypothetical protein
MHTKPSPPTLRCIDGVSPHPTSTTSTSSDTTAATGGTFSSSCASASDLDPDLDDCIRQATADLEPVKVVGSNVPYWPQSYSPLYLARWGWHMASVVLGLFAALGFAVMMFTVLFFLPA